jgi:hypothetical protein
MGPPALLPLRRKACWGFFRPEKSDGFGRIWTRTWALEASTHPLDHPSRSNLNCCIAHLVALSSVIEPCGESVSQQTYFNVCYRFVSDGLCLYGWRQNIHVSRGKEWHRLQFKGARKLHALTRCKRGGLVSMRVKCEAWDSYSGADEDFPTNSKWYPAQSLAVPTSSVTRRSHISETRLVNDTKYSVCFKCLLLLVLCTKPDYAHTVYTTVQFVSLICISAITSSSESITHQADLLWVKKQCGKRNTTWKE